MGGDGDHDFGAAAALSGAYVDLGEKTDATSWGCAWLTDEDLEELKDVEKNKDFAGVDLKISGRSGSLGGTPEQVYSSTYDYSNIVKPDKYFTVKRDDEKKKLIFTESTKDAYDKYKEEKKKTETTSNRGGRRRRRRKSRSKSRKSRRKSRKTKRKSRKSRKTKKRRRTRRRRR